MIWHLAGHHDNAWFEVSFTNYKDIQSLTSLGCSGLSVTFTVEHIKEEEEEENRCDVRGFGYTVIN